MLRSDTLNWAAYMKGLYVPFQGTNTSDHAWGGIIGKPDLSCRINIGVPGSMVGPSPDPASHPCQGAWEAVLL